VAEAAEIFARGGIYDNEAIEQEKAELYEQIGRLQDQRRRWRGRSFTLKDVRTRQFRSK
jgi:hypothetical protein